MSRFRFFILCFVCFIFRFFNKLVSSFLGCDSTVWRVRMVEPGWIFFGFFLFKNVISVLFVFFPLCRICLGFLERLLKVILKEGFLALYFVLRTYTNVLFRFRHRLYESQRFKVRNIAD